MSRSRCCSGAGSSGTALRMPVLAVFALVIVRIRWPHRRARVLPTLLRTGSDDWLRASPPLESAGLHPVVGTQVRTATLPGLPDSGRGSDISWVALKLR